MRRRKEMKFATVIVVLITGFILLFADILIYLIIMFNLSLVDYPSSREILANLTFENGTYKLKKQETEKIRKNNYFAMLIDDGGNIVWSESLPDKLYKTYTLKDVAGFTRYYLEDYPVRTYVADEGLLVIGEKTDKVWKYTLEYGSERMRTAILITPLLFVINAVVLITVPVTLQKRRQRQKEEERTEWIAGVSHDIRTPLAIIMGNAETISNLTEDEEIKKKADLIEKQGIRLRTLVENLNLSSKLDFGLGKFEKKEIKLSRFLRKIITEFMNQTEDERYEFELEIDDSLQDIQVKANENLFERAVINLIINAMRHNPECCKIEVKLYKNIKNVLILEISDNGKGVAEEFLKELNSKDYEYKIVNGTHGLGLKIVKQVAGFHGWRVEFAKNKKSGFICRFSLK